jgi:hypothetical protein
MFREYFRRIAIAKEKTVYLKILGKVLGGCSNGAAT